MRFKNYIVEDRLDEMAIKSKKDQTAHSHTGVVNVDGDGKTTSTNGVEDHEHIIFNWLIQPAHGHVHNLEE